MRSAVAATLLLIACSKPVPPSTTTMSPQSTMPQEGTAVTSTNSPRITMPDGTVYAIEVVADNEQRAQGLMFRDHLLPNTGMLFVFPDDGEYAFWMKNTLIPLDMLWLDVNRTVVHVKHDVPPCKVDDCPSYPPGVEARYVLELAAGEAKKHGLKVGDRLVLAGTDDIVPR